MTENTHAGRLIVLTGPTAVGKGTVEAKLRADHPEVWVSVSATTRAPRPGEVDGVNYWFLTEDEFLAREAAGEFLETAVVHGMAHYGTLLKPVEEHLAAGVPTILEIDLQGARRVKQRAAKLRRARAPPDRPRHRNRRTAGPSLGDRQGGARRRKRIRRHHRQRNRRSGRCRPLVRHRQGIRAVNYLFTTNCWWRISALFLAGACFQRIASVS